MKNIITINMDTESFPYPIIAITKRKETEYFVVHKLNKKYMIADMSTGKLIEGSTDLDITVRDFVKSKDSEILSEYKTNGWLYSRIDVYKPDSVETIEHRHY